MKMLITLDRDKILSEGVYHFADMYVCVDEVFRRRGVNVAWDGEQRIYEDLGEHALSNFLICMDILEHTEWFMDNVSRWFLITSTTTEDILAEIRKSEG